MNNRTMKNNDREWEKKTHNTNNGEQNPQMNYKKTLKYKETHKVGEIFYKNPSDKQIIKINV